MNLLDRVRLTIVEQKMFSPHDKVVVGVSGGPDSLALLHLLRALSGDLQIELHVAHLNHQLRGSQADADAEFVAHVAREWGLPVTIESRDVKSLAGEYHLSIEEAAREARYSFFAEVAARVGAGVIVVAHQADDQVESVLMHFLRGSGLAGLRGMQYQVRIPKAKGQRQNAKLKTVTDAEQVESPASNSPIRLVRPLLDVTRKEIEAYCKENELTPHFDETNLDTSLYRNRLRHEVVPYLERLNPGLRQVLRHTSRVAADDYEIVQREVSSAFAEVAREEAGVVVFARHIWRSLPPALRRGTIRAAVAQLRDDLRDLDWVHVENAHRIALEKEVGARATLPRGLVLLIGYDEFAIGNETRVQEWTSSGGWPLLEVDRLELPTQGVVFLPDSNWLVETQLTSDRGDVGGRWTARFDFDECGGERFLRPRRPRERFKPAGLGGHTRLLSRFMIDEKVPQGIRARLPLLVAGEHILWVCGLRIDERARVKPETRQVWQVRFRKKES